MVGTLETVFPSFFSFPNKRLINQGICLHYTNYYKPEVMGERLKLSMKLNKPLKAKVSIKLYEAVLISELF